MLFSLSALIFTWLPGSRRAAWIEAGTLMLMTSADPASRRAAIAVAVTVTALWLQASLASDRERARRPARLRDQYHAARLDRGRLGSGDRLAGDRPGRRGSLRAVHRRRHRRTRGRAPDRAGRHGPAAVQAASRGRCRSPGQLPRDRTQAVADRPLAVGQHLAPDRVPPAVGRDRPGRRPVARCWLAPAVAISYLVLGPPSPEAATATSVAAVALLFAARGSRNWSLASTNTWPERCSDPAGAKNSRCGWSRWPGAGPRSSRPPTRSAAGSSGTCTTAPSSGWCRWR